MKAFFGLFAGTLFGAGLVVSGMAEPERVLAFLTLSGDWEPALAFVMGSALIVTAICYRLTMRREHPLFDASFHLPASTVIDIRLVLGSAIFGVGWGVAGYCPGPAIVGAMLMDLRALVFIGAFLGGLLLFELTLNRAGTSAVQSGSRGV